MERSSPAARTSVGVLSIGVLVLALFMGFFNLSGDLMNNDEETYLYGAWRVSLGEVPYADFLLVQTPLSFYAVGGLFKIVGPSVWWARALSFLFVLGAAFLVYLAAKKTLRFSSGIALLVGSVFLFTKHIYFLGRSYMPDCAMLFFGAAALYFALMAETDEESSKRPWLPIFLFGAFSGLAVLSKLNAVLFMAGYGLFCMILLVGKMDGPRGVFRRVGFSAAGFLATFGLVFGLFLIFVPNTFHDILGVHAAKAKIAGAELVLAWLQRLVWFVGNHNYGLVSVAIAGLFLGRFWKDRRRILLVVLTAAVVSQVLMPVVFYLRYVALALIPLALLFGDGVVGLLSLKKGKVLALCAAAVLVLFCLAPTFSPKKLLYDDQGTRRVAAYIRAATAPSDYVFGDTPFVNFYPLRPCPPALVDCSMARTKSGQVTPADIRRECDRYRVKLIVVERGGAAHNLKNLRDYSQFQGYLDESYDLVKTMPREFLTVDIYRRKDTK